MPNHLAPFIQALSNPGSYIVSLAITSDENTEYGYVDVKERGGNEQAIHQELEKLGYVEIVSFRQNDSDQLLTFGDGKTTGKSARQ
jgi:hypothetical protein